MIYVVLLPFEDFVQVFGSRTDVERLDGKKRWMEKRLTAYKEHGTYEDLLDKGYMVVIPCEMYYDGA